MRSPGARGSGSAAASSQTNLAFDATRCGSSPYRAWNASAMPSDRKTCVVFCGNAETICAIGRLNSSM
jgi:hypothetical protein